MKITDIEHTLIYIPFTRSALWASGRRPGMTRLIIRVFTDTDIVGYGETICLWEFVEPILRKSIIPLLIGEDPRNIERISKKVEAAGFYHHKRALVAAMAGVELALWDILGKAAELPVYRLLGGRYRDEVPMIAYIHIDEPEAMAVEAQEYVAKGFKTVKAKVGLDPYDDIEIVKTLREAVGPNIQLRADVNGAWTPGTAKRQITKMSRYDLEYVEQPLMLDDTLGHAELRRWSPIPIALDESAYTFQDVANIIRVGAADVILLDPHEAGGLWPSKKAAAMAEAVGIPCGMHGPAECGISMAARLHLAASTPNISLAVDSEYHIMVDDVVTVPFEYIDGTMSPPEAPGLGVELDMEKVVRYKVDEIKDAYFDPEHPDQFNVKPAY